MRFDKGDVTIAVQWYSKLAKDETEQSVEMGTPGMSIFNSTELLLINTSLSETCRWERISRSGGAASGALSRSSRKRSESRVRRRGQSKSRGGAGRWTRPLRVLH